MKRTLILFTSLLIVAGCGSSDDAAVKKNLPGVWHFVSSPSDASGDTGTFTIAPDGGFTGRISSKGDHIVDVVGTFQVQDGYLVGTVTQRDSGLPYVSRAKIDRADPDEMVIIYDGTTNPVTLKKDGSSQAANNRGGAYPATFDQFLAQNSANEKSSGAVQTLAVLAVVLLVAMAVVGRWLLRR